MIIRKKRIRSINKNIRGIRKGDFVVTGISDIERFESHLKEIGFTKNLSPGERILPGVVGPITRYNAEGKYEIHKNQAMEIAYRQADWKWKEYHGRYDTVEMSKIVDIPYKRYPRTFIPPPSIELSIAQLKDGEKILIAPKIEFTATNYENLIHIVNVFLENFGECELFEENLKPIAASNLIQLNWKILPQGKMPWTKLRAHLMLIIDRQPKGNRSVIEKRHETISDYGPEFVAIGQGGFDGYVVFGFPAKSLYILESIQINNATYILDKDWEELSSMTKAELLNNNLHKERIIHRESWFDAVNQVLQK